MLFTVLLILNIFIDDLEFLIVKLHYNLAVDSTFITFVYSCVFSLEIKSRVASFVKLIICITRLPLLQGPSRGLEVTAQGI